MNLILIEFVETKEWISFRSFDLGKVLNRHSRDEETEYRIWDGIWINLYKCQDEGCKKKSCN